MIRYKQAAGFFFALLGWFLVGPLALAQAQEPNKPMVYEDSPGGVRFIEEGQPPVIIHPTVDAMRRAREADAGTKPGVKAGAGIVNNLSYHGGTSGVGVQTKPKIYLVLWGSQWNGNDPSGEAAILERFYSGVGGSSWVDTVTQYCQGVASGTVFCKGAGSAADAGNPTGVYVTVWADNAGVAPSKPRQSQIAAEAVRAAQHFGNAATANLNAQYVIATSTGHSSSGFKSSYCAYHSWTSNASTGSVSYTNLPYITDAGANCGANFNGLGADAGITIVSGHEMAESITDPFPNGGWLDSGGQEIGDKCAWISSGQGASANISLSTGTFAVQSLWSNAFGGDAGGCVITYP